MSEIGHNGGPALAVGKFSKKRWALAVFSHPKKPAGAVAMAFKLYVEMSATGSGAAVPDREFVDSCGVSERACQNFKKWLVREGFVKIAVRGHKGQCNTFAALIPGDELPAPIAGNHEDDRHPLPASALQPAAPIAGKTELTAPIAGNPSPAGESFPHTPFKETNKNNLLASVGDNSAREECQLAVLNGAKALIVEQLATWLSPYAPDTVTAERWLVTAITMHGGMVVKEAFGELQAQIASGDLISRPIVVLNKICERIKRSPRGHPPGSQSDAKRQIDAIVGRRS